MKRLFCKEHDLVATIRSLFDEKGQATELAELTCPNGHSEVVKSPTGDSIFERFEWREQSDAPRTLAELVNDPIFDANEKPLIQAARYLLRLALEPHALYVYVTNEAPK